MNRSNNYPVFQAISAAILFGSSAPISKLLLGNIEPIPLAAFLYLGSGIGLLLLKTLQHLINKKDTFEAPLSKKDVPWLLGAVAFGGIAAPILLLVSLDKTPASTASLLLNFEGASTAVIAFIIFKENINVRVGIAIGLITISSILLSWDAGNKWGVSLGALGIISACICWGIDNNLTRNISSKDPFAIVIIKGLGAGSFSLVLSLFLGIGLPELRIILAATVLGFISYGLSIVLFVLALRNMGSARTSAFFGTAPFIGTALSFLLFRSTPGIMFVIAIPIMITGAFLILKDKHAHPHFHQKVMHEHRHTHSDGHHNHVHDNMEVSDSSFHSHMHVHEAMEHSHEHMPDIHHRHSHSK